jgi:hypothetical protein
LRIALPSKKKSHPACAVCRHPDRALIEQIHVAGASLDTISAKFGMSRFSVFRHCKNHLSDDLRSELLAQVPIADLAAKAAEENLTVLQYLSLVRATLVRQMQLAASVNDKNGTAITARVLNETLRQIAVITGEMSNLAARHVSVNTVIMNSPIFADLQAMLLRRLAPYPEALASVLEGLRELEAKASPPSNGAMLIEAKPLEHAHGQ